MLCHSVAAYTLTVESWARHSAYRETLCTYHMHLLLSWMGMVEDRKVGDKTRDAGDAVDALPFLPDCMDRDDGRHLPALRMHTGRPRALPEAQHPAAAPIPVAVIAHDATAPAATNGQREGQALKVMNVMALGALTPRQREVVLLVARGETQRAIAQQLGHSIGAVKMMTHRAYVRLGVRNCAQLIAVLDCRTAAEANVVVVAALSPPERMVAQLAARGSTRSEIGRLLMLSHASVGTMLYHAYAKLHVHTRVELVYALDHMHAHEREPSQEYEAAHAQSKAC